MSSQEPPPYEPSTSAPTSTSTNPTTPPSSSGSKAYGKNIIATPPPLFCCPFNLSTTTQADSPALLTAHTAYDIRILGPQPDTATHGKYNRFFLWAGHGICRPHAVSASNVVIKSVLWVYVIEVLDYRPCSSAVEGGGKPTVRYFVAKSDRERGGFESCPYGLGNGLRMSNLALKASMILKCVEHGNWFEVNFYV